MFWKKLLIIFLIGYLKYRVSLTFASVLTTFVAYLNLLSFILLNFEDSLKIMNWILVLLMIWWYTNQKTLKRSNYMYFSLKNLLLDLNEDNSSNLEIKENNKALSSLHHFISCYRVQRVFAFFPTYRTIWRNASYTRGFICYTRLY